MKSTAFPARLDIRQGLEEIQSTESAVLLDVRTPEEYSQGCLPGSLNIPLQQLEQVLQAVPDKYTPLYVYCRSGARSQAAQKKLYSMGYHHVTDLGGLIYYQGPLSV